MKKILFMAGSNSSRSINRELAYYTAKKITSANTNELNLNDYPLPIYGIDVEDNEGIPPKVYQFLEQIEISDALIISLAEHNGNFTVAFKNILDWASRVDRNIFKDKPIFLLSTSPGDRGAANVFELAKNIFPRFKADIASSFKLPSYNKNFSIKDGILNSELNEVYLKELQIFQEKISTSL